MNKISAMLKFTECFGMHIKLVNYEAKNESFFVEKGIDVSAFKRLMIKNDMDEYTFILLAYFIERYFKFNIKDSMIKYNEKLDEEETKRKHEIELTQLLLFLLSKNYGEYTSITFQKSRNSLTISNQLISKSIIDGLIHEFKCNGYNKVNLSYDEAKVMMATDDEWAKGLFCEVNYGSDDDPNIVEVEFAEAIEYFASNTTKEVEVDLDYLTCKYEILNRNKKKKGAKIKKYHTAILCEDLSLLKRIERYLNQSEIEFIDDIKITNDDCRFIHDCLVFFNIIEDKSTTLTKSLPENYIRGLLKQKKQDEFDIDLNHFRRLRINDLRNSKAF